MKRLIVNADDFGWSDAVTSGILEGHCEGILTSTTLMANLPGAEEALERARRDAPNLAIGLHLNLTEGRPLAPPREVAAILDSGGRLLGSLMPLFRRIRTSAAAREAAAKEFEAQARWAADHGLKPTHLDGHKHVHLHPRVLPLAVALARRHGIPAIRTTAEFRPRGLRRLLPATWGMKARTRQWLLATVARRWARKARPAVREAGLATTDWFFGVRATGGISADLLLHLLRHAPQGTGELMVHPGLAGPDGERHGRLKESRPLELAALCDPRVRRAAEETGWVFATYRDIS